MGSSSTSNNLSSDDEACLYALQLVSLSVLPMTLRAATELELLDTVAAAGPGACLAPSEIAAKLPTTNTQAPALVDRVLRLLAAYDVVRSTVVTGEDGRTERRYGAAPVTKYLCKDEDGVSLAAMGHLQHGQACMESWHYLKNCILEGGNPFTKAHGMSIFEYGRTNPNFNAIFNDAMKNYSGVVMKKILQVYKGFDDLNVLVDVGGCTGATLGMIRAKHPHVKGINFDLPHVISEAPPLPGVEHIGGDMFESVPSGDAIFMKLVLHAYDDEHGLKLLKNCWQALPENGKVIVVEGNLPMTAEPSPAEKYVIHLDLMMLAQSPTGKERTEKEYEILAKAAGFSGFRKVCTGADLSVMELYK